MATIDEEIHEEHARQAAFLWLLRDNAVRDAAYDLADLAELDERLEAHLDGLRLAGDGGWEACKALLADAEGGEVFGATAVAVERWDLKGVARVLDTFGGVRDLGRGFISALGWMPFEQVQRILPGLLAGRCAPALQWLGISACAVHRKDPGPALGYAMLSTDTRLKARALRAAGELGRAGLLPEIRNELRSNDEACRFWAAHSAVLLGEAAAAQPLWAMATGGGPFAERAACLAMRRMEPRIGYTWLYSLAGMAGDVRVPIAAAAALGDPTIVPWLFDCMSSPKTARLAGFSFAMITGVDLEQEKLSAKPPQDFQAGPTDDPHDDDVAMDPDESHAWPDRAGIEAWWREHGADFKRGTRYLLGKPVTAAWLEEVLRSGHQPSRAGAAVELVLQHRPGRALFEVRAPAFRQTRELRGETG